MTGEPDSKGMPPLTGGVCVVTAGGPFAWIIANALAGRVGPVRMAVETPESYRTLLARRARKLGYISVAGQFATMVLIRLGKRLAAGRISRIVETEGLEPQPSPGIPVTHVSSVNGEDFVRFVAETKPTVLLLVGCRMMKPDTLRQLPCTVLNYHAGITPRYRGMNGGYWALANGDAENYGATVHLVDEGVDTGAIAAQVRGAPGPGDTIMTHAYRLAAMSRGMCCDTVETALAGRLETKAPEGPSRQWYHPTLWGYFWTGVTRGVW